jgi:hypothetical protein
MMLATIKLATMLASGYAATEAVIDREGRLVVAVGTQAVGRQSDLVVDPLGDESQPIERWKLAWSEQLKQCGPVTWGVHRDGYHVVSLHDKFGDVTAHCYTFSLVDEIQVRRARREENRMDMEARARGNTYSAAHDRHVGPLNVAFWSASIDEHLNAGDIVIPFDLVFTADNHALFAMIRDGRMRWWTWNRPEETDWVEHDAVATEIDSAFRIMRAGDDLYFVDDDGRVYSSPAEGHRVVGSIIGWRTPRDGESLFLLEEHRLNKIAAVYVGESAIEVLPFAGEAGATEDFIGAIDDAFVRDGLVRMTAILNGRDDQGGE